MDEHEALPREHGTVFRLQAGSLPTHSTLPRSKLPNLVREPNADVKPATWNWFALTGEDPRPLFAFAGLWRRQVGPIRKYGPSVELDVFSFLTTTPNALVETVDHERMPVLLSTPVAQDQWMDGSDEEAFALCKPYPPEMMRLVQISYEKRDLLGLKFARTQAGRSGGEEQRP